MVAPSAVLSHVALLVPSTEKAAPIFGKLGLEVNEPQVWEGEGTKEIYIGNLKSQMALPLLMEPVNENGSYARALKKRGPGIHHIAVDVLNIEEYVQSLSGSGWFLHLHSLKHLRQMKTVYLARPGMPTLIEVQEKESLCQDPPVIAEIHMNLEPAQMTMMQALGLKQIVVANETAVTINNQKIYFKELV